MPENLDRLWLLAVESISRFGRRVEPRGKPTNELLHQTVALDMTRPVLTHPGRKLNYQFMAAEAYWILSGDNTVAGIAQIGRAHV